MLRDNAPLTDVEFVAFDLETTGLYALSGQIVEIGAVRFRLDGARLDAFEQLVDPQCEITEEVTRIHGITQDMVRGKPPIAEALPRFLEFLGAPERILLAHNAEFDLSFLALAMARLRLPYPPHPILDTLELARRRVRGARTFKLEDLAIHLCVADGEEHRGLSDATLLARVFCRMLARASSLRTVGDLFRICRRWSFRDGDALPLDPPRGFEAVAAAIEEQRSMLIVYEGGTKGSAERRVTPRAFVLVAGRPYLCAFCHADGIEKSYRLERLRAFRIEE